MQNDQDKKADKAETSKKKSFWGGLVEKIDKAMVEKSNQSSCCAGHSKDGKCC